MSELNENKPEHSEDSVKDLLRNSYLSTEEINTPLMQAARSIHEKLLCYYDKISYETDTENYSCRISANCIFAEDFGIKEAFMNIPIAMKSVYSEFQNNPKNVRHEFLKQVTESAQYVSLYRDILTKYSEILETGPIHFEIYFNLVINPKNESSGSILSNASLLDNNNEINSIVSKLNEVIHNSITGLVNLIQETDGIRCLRSDNPVKSFDTDHRISQNSIYLPIKKEFRTTVSEKIQIFTN